MAHFLSTHFRKSDVIRLNQTPWDHDALTTTDAIPTTSERCSIVTMPGVSGRLAVSATAQCAVGMSASGTVLFTWHNAAGVLSVGRPHIVVPFHGPDGSLDGVSVDLVTDGIILRPRIIGLTSKELHWSLEIKNDCHRKGVVK